MINNTRKEFNHSIENNYIKEHPYCEYCGKSVLAEHVHHIIPISSGGDNRESNLISLCVECHEKIHDRKLTHKELQRQGIEKAKREGKYKGRQKKIINKELFRRKYDDYLKKNITKTQMAKDLNISRPTLDRWIKEELNK